MKQLLADIKYSSRQLRRSPGLTLAAMTVAGEIADVKQTAADEQTQPQINSVLAQYRALAASVVPARRAASIQPMQVLRME